MPSPRKRKLRKEVGRVADRHASDLVPTGSAGLDSAFEMGAYGSTAAVASGYSLEGGREQGRLFESGDSLKITDALSSEDSVLATGESQLHVLWAGNDITHYWMDHYSNTTSASPVTNQHGIIYSSDGPRADYMPGYEELSGSAVEFFFKPTVDGVAWSASDKVVITISGTIAPDDELSLFQTGTAGASADNLIDGTSGGTIAATVTASFDNAGSDANDAGFFVRWHVKSDPTTDAAKQAYKGFVVSWSLSLIHI